MMNIQILRQQEHFAKKFTLERDGPGLLCKFSGHCTADDFFDASIELINHSRFERAFFCIYDMDLVDNFTKGQLNLHYILANILGCISANPNIKHAIVSENESVLTWATWLRKHTDRKVGYFRIMSIARLWTNLSPWTNQNFDIFGEA